MEMPETRGTTGFTGVYPVGDPNNPYPTSTAAKVGLGVLGIISVTGIVLGVATYARLRQREEDLRRRRGAAARRIARKKSQRAEDVNRAANRTGNAKARGVYDSSSGVLRTVVDSTAGTAAGGDSIRAAFTNCAPQSTAPYSYRGSRYDDDGHPCGTGCGVSPAVCGQLLKGIDSKPTQWHNQYTWPEEQLANWRVKPPAACCVSQTAVPGSCYSSPVLM